MDLQPHSYVRAAGSRVGRHARKRVGMSTTAAAVVETIKTACCWWLPLTGLSLAAVSFAAHRRDEARLEARPGRVSRWFEEPGFNGAENQQERVEVLSPQYALTGRLGRPNLFRGMEVDDALVRHLRSFCYFKVRDHTLMETLRNRARVYLAERKVLDRLGHLIPGSVAEALVPSDHEMRAIRFVMVTGSSRIAEVNAALRGSTRVPGSYGLWSSFLTLRGLRTMGTTLADWWASRPIPVV